MEMEIVAIDDSKEMAAYKAKAGEYLKEMGLKLPQKQQSQFLELASALKLNPFKREIYAVGYGENYNIITGYEVYIKRAERSGKLNGWKATVEGSGENMVATVTINRKDWSFPFEHSVLFSEVCNKTKDGKLNSVWSKMPSFMCKKVAIAQAFRLCFPDELGGMPYTADELPEVEETSEKPLKQAKKSEANETALMIKSLLEESRYDNGELIFGELDKENARKVCKESGAQVALDMVKEILAARVSTQGNK